MSMSVYAGTWRLAIAAGVSIPLVAVELPRPGIDPHPVTDVRPAMRFGEDVKIEAWEVSASGAVDILARSDSGAPPVMRVQQSTSFLSGSHVRLTTRPRNLQESLPRDLANTLPAPLARITPSVISGTVPFTVTLNSNLSADPAGQAISRVWKNAAGTVLGNGTSLSQTISTSGTHRFTLTINTADGRQAVEEVTIGALPASMVTISGDVTIDGSDPAYRDRSVRIESRSNVTVRGPCRFANLEILSDAYVYGMRVGTETAPAPRTLDIEVAGVFINKGALAVRDFYRVNSPADIPYGDGGGPYPAATLGAGGSHAGPGALELAWDQVSRTTLSQLVRGTFRLDQGQFPGYGGRLQYSNGSTSYRAAPGGGIIKIKATVFDTTGRLWASGWEANQEFTYYSTRYTIFGGGGAGAGGSIFIDVDQLHSASLGFEVSGGSVPYNSQQYGPGAGGRVHIKARRWSGASLRDASGALRFKTTAWQAGPGLYGSAPGAGGTVFIETPNVQAAKVGTQDGIYGDLVDVQMPLVMVVGSSRGGGGAAAVTPLWLGDVTQTSGQAKYLPQLDILAYDGGRFVVTGDTSAFDSDNDGIMSHVEMRPLAGVPATDPLRADTDGDGWTDAQESSMGLSPIQMDDDGDGLSNAQEQYLGTNPYISDSDHDGVADGQDQAPMDPQSSSWNPGDAGDSTPPVITIISPGTLTKLL